MTIATPTVAKAFSLRLFTPIIVIQAVSQRIFPFFRPSGKGLNEEGLGS